MRSSVSRGYLDDGGRVGQETRGWSDERGVTFSQRSKEYAHDYRYFPEPDLPPVVIGREWVDQLRASDCQNFPWLDDADLPMSTGSRTTTPIC